MEGSLEDELLHAARQFGITGLVQGQKEAWLEGREPQIHDGHSEKGKTAADCPVFRTPRVSVWTLLSVARLRIFLPVLPVVHRWMEIAMVSPAPLS